MQLIAKRLIPTLIHRLSEELNDNNFYIKREDLIPISLVVIKPESAIIL